MGRNRVSMLQLSKATGIPRSTLAYQINANVLSVNNLIRIADALAVTVAELISERAA